VLKLPHVFGESHSPVVHELWVLVVAGSNPASPTKREEKRFENKDLQNGLDHRFPLVARKHGNCGGEVRCIRVNVALCNVELAVAGEDPHRFDTCPVTDEN
jgi:hypothetical protein